MSEKNEKTNPIHLAHLDPENQPYPIPGMTFDNGALLLAVKRQAGFRTWFWTLCWRPDACEYVVWGWNREDGLFYWGDYFEGFKEASETYNAKK